MNINERYVSTIIFKDGKRKAVIQFGSKTIDEFFKKLFDKYQNADEIKARKLYNPLFSNPDEVDDNRTLIARNRNPKLSKIYYIIQEQEEKVFFPGYEDSEEISEY